jgi:hypothetical protein
MRQIELGASALEDRAHDDGDQQPRVDREQHGSQKGEPRGVGGRRLVHRFAILTVFGAILTSVIAWTAFLVFAVVWLVEAV